MTRPATHHIVTIKNLPGTVPEYKHRIDVTGKVGTSAYDRALDGIYRRIDLDRFSVDSDVADAAHERLRSEPRS